MKLGKYKNHILISLGVLVFSVIVWYTVVKTVDNRLSNIEIKMPTIKIPKQEVVVVEGFNGGKLTGNASDEPSNFSKLSHIRSEQNKQTLQPTPVGGFDSNSISSTGCDTCSQCMPPDVKSASGLPKEVYLIEKDPVMEKASSNQAKVKVKDIDTCKEDKDCNVIYSGNICKANGKCHCVKGSGKFCHLGPTNYKELEDMTMEERAEFKSKYWNNMTIRDYMNWLSLYFEDAHNLEEIHRKNLNKIKKGGKITVDDIPRYRSDPPMNAGDYYSSMWCKGNVGIKFPINSETGPFLPSNAGEYSEFLPPEEGIGRPILANQDEKADAYELDYLIRPRVTTGAERTEIGRRYRQRQKERRDKKSTFKDEPWVFHKLDSPEYNLPDEILDRVYYKNFT